MANGDKPPGGVAVTVEGPEGRQIFGISCHTHKDAVQCFDKITSFIEGVKAQYEQNVKPEKVEKKK